LMDHAVEILIVDVLKLKGLTTPIVIGRIC